MTGLDLRARLRVRSLGPLNLPAEFTWRGQRHVIRRLERLPGAGSLGRYRLTTTDGLRCIVAQDRDRCAWHIERVLPNPAGGAGGWR